MYVKTIKCPQNLYEPNGYGTNNEKVEHLTSQFKGLIIWCFPKKRQDALVSRILGWL